LNLLSDDWSTRFSGKIFAHGHYAIGSFISDFDMVQRRKRSPSRPASKRIKVGDNHVGLTLQDWWIVADGMSRSGCYLEVVTLLTTCKMFNGFNKSLVSMRKRAIVKHTFQKVYPRTAEYFPRILPLFLMKCNGMPVAKQYRKISMMPWDIPEKYRHENWTAPPIECSAYARLFHEDMKLDVPVYGLDGHLPGLLYCETQLYKGYTSGGWPTTSRFYGRIIIRIYQHELHHLLTIVCRKVLLSLIPLPGYRFNGLADNSAIVWAYFLSLNRLSHGRFSASEHSTFVSILKLFMKEIRDETAPKFDNDVTPMTALPPLDSLDLGKTLIQIKKDKFIGCGAVYVRVFLAHLRNMWVALPIPKEAECEPLLEIVAVFEKYHPLLIKEYDVQDKYRTITSDEAWRRSYREFQTFMGVLLGKPWKDFYYSCIVDEPLE
jgi:hypothetical protein